MNLKDAVLVFERALLETALVACEWNQRKAAVVLGVLPTTLLEKMHRHNLRPPGARWSRVMSRKTSVSDSNHAHHGSVPAIEIGAQVDSWENRRRP